MMLFRKNFSVLSLRWFKRLISSAKILPRENLPEPAYKPKLVEKDKFKRWEKENLFEAVNSRDRAIFSMVLPPPNVTGKLHLGHALTCTIQDVTLRRLRALGYNVMWLPGTDHAGIATQTVVEKYLKSTENLSRHSMDRSKFIDQVWKWKAKHGGTICDQLRTLGCSLDWSRETFTMNQKHNNAVTTAFIKLFEDGLVYRKKALVNWCTALKSTVSDIEVDNIEINGPTNIAIQGYENPVKFGLMYNIAYKIFGTNEEIIVSTTMPETLLGDTAIAVHPDDDRYKHLLSKRAVHPFNNRTIPIIFDKFVDMKLGTGAVKITPAHSKIDYEVGAQHKLPIIEVINEDGLIINANEFNDMKKYDCRELLLEKLKEKGLLREVTPHDMILPICSRTGAVIDYIPKEQWFLSCSELNKVAYNLVDQKQLNITPEKFVKNWLNWTNDDRDWCISRQLWWGHQIPAYKCTAGDKDVWVAATDEETALLEASKVFRQPIASIKAERDSDVLDTWFSAGIYPFAALGWPVKTPDLKMFYPLSLMVTGHDILGFWVHRMVILGLQLTGSLPFKDIFLHGIICDNKGAKMSKSKGNVIDPLDVINGISLKDLKNKTKQMQAEGILSSDETSKALAYQRLNFNRHDGIPECGVDALRFTLMSNDIKSNFINFDLDYCHSNKLFCNKIWQSVKYTGLSFDMLGKTHNEEVTRNDLTYFDKWILSRLSNMVETVNKSMNSFDFHIATKAMRSLIYNEFCDVYLETTKPDFNGEKSTAAYAHAHTLSAVLNTSLRCLSPFMVYLTDELIPRIPNFETNIVHNFDDLQKKQYNFPNTDHFKMWKNDEFEKQVDKVLNVISLVRELKAIYKMPNKVTPEIHIFTTDQQLMEDIRNHSDTVLFITRCSSLQFGASSDTKKKFAKGFVDKHTEILVEVISDDVYKTMAEARETLRKRIKKMEDSLVKLEEQFASDRYKSSVPEWTRNSDMEKLKAKKEELKQLQRLIE